MADDLNRCDESFRFEALGAPIPIMAAQWPGDEPQLARLFFHNEKFLDIYGDHRGRLLTDVFDEVLAAQAPANARRGAELLQTLLHDGFVRAVQGHLANKRVELFAKRQVHSDRRIQSSVFDITERLLDHTTGLPGRELFFDRLAVSLFKAQRERQPLALLFLDLDGFKKANDVFGHKTGDLVLTTVAQRLRGLIRRHETAARIGGDEFVLILSESAAEAGLQFAQDKVIPALNAPYPADSGQVDFIGVSVGIASYPRHSASGDVLLSLADEAMYKAKAGGKNRAIVI